MLPRQGSQLLQDGEDRALPLDDRMVHEEASDSADDFERGEARPWRKTAISHTLTQSRVSLFVHSEKHYGYMIR